MIESQVMNDWIQQWFKNVQKRSENGHRVKYSTLNVKLEGDEDSDVFTSHASIILGCTRDLCTCIHHPFSLYHQTT